MNEGYSKPDDPTMAQVRLTPPMQSERWPYVPATPPVASPFRPGKSVNPEQLIRRPAASTLPRNPMQKIVHLWHADPAYKVFMIAIGTGIVSAIVAVILVSSFFSNIFAQPASSSQSYAPTVTTTAPTATATSLPTPNASLQSSLPPLSATPTMPPATPTPVADGPLTLQITNVPATARNGSSVPVSVAANKSGVSVKLNVTYTVPPNRYTSGSHTTDGNGNATINWRIGVLNFNPRGGSVIAHLTVVAKDTNGKTISSQTVSVQITNKG